MSSDVVAVNGNGKKLERPLGMFQALRIVLSRSFKVNRVDHEGRPLLPRVKVGWLTVPTKTALAIAVVNAVFGLILVFLLLNSGFGFDLSAWYGKVFSNEAMRNTLIFGWFSSVVLVVFAAYYAKIAYRTFCQPKSFASEEAIRSYGVIMLVVVPIATIAIALWGIGAILGTVSGSEHELAEYHANQPWKIDVPEWALKTVARLPQDVIDTLKNRNALITEADRQTVRELEKQSSVLYRMNFPIEGNVLGVIDLTGILVLMVPGMLFAFWLPQSGILDTFGIASEEEQKKALFEADEETLSRALAVNLKGVQDIFDEGLVRGRGDKHAWKHIEKAVEMKRKQRIRSESEHSNVADATTQSSTEGGV